MVSVSIDGDLWRCFLENDFVPDSGHLGLNAGLGVRLFRSRGEIWWDGRASLR